MEIRINTLDPGKYRFLAESHETKLDTPNICNHIDFFWKKIGPEHIKNI